MLTLQCLPRCPGHTAAPHRTAARTARGRSSAVGKHLNSSNNSVQCHQCLLEPQTSNNCKLGTNWGQTLMEAVFELWDVSSDANISWAQQSKAANIWLFIIFRIEMNYWRLREIAEIWIRMTHSKSFIFHFRWEKSLFSIVKYLFQSPPSYYTLHVLQVACLEFHIWLHIIFL